MPVCLAAMGGRLAGGLALECLGDARGALALEVCHRIELVVPVGVLRERQKVVPVGCLANGVGVLEVAASVRVNPVVLAGRTGLFDSELCTHGVPFLVGVTPGYVNLVYIATPFTFPVQPASRGTLVGMENVLPNLPWAFGGHFSNVSAGGLG